MNVYLITSGEYDDYGVDAVALTKEAAEAYVAADFDPKTGYSKRGPYAYELCIEVRKSI